MKQLQPKAMTDSTPPQTEISLIGMVRELTQRWLRLILVSFGAGGLYATHLLTLQFAARQSNDGRLGLSSSQAGLQTQPGDSMFVLEGMTKSTFAQDANNWKQIVAIFVLRTAALQTVSNSCSGHRSRV